MDVVWRRMVRFINKGLKAHNYKIDEFASSTISPESLYKLAELLNSHLKDFAGKTTDLTHFLQKTTIQLKLTALPHLYTRIRIDKIFKIRKDLVKMKIGIINNKAFEKIKLEISKVF